MDLINKLSGRFSKSTPREALNNIQFSSGLGDSAWLLYALCRSIKPQVAVEIGSARGKSACFVGTALKENGKGHLYAIDPHTQTKWNDFESVDTYNVMSANLDRLGLQSVVSIVRKTSLEALTDWQQKIDLIFIDGDHSYEGVRADWEGFRPFISEFGLVVFHDTLWELRPDPKWARSDMGVPKIVEELRQEGFPVLTIDQDCGVSLVQPTKNGNPLVGRGQ
jgi:predicted O-methyltransferase YrrM